MRKENEIPQQGLYRESFEHDNCGIGAIVNIKGQKSHSTVVGKCFNIVENWSIEPERMQKERQEMVLEF